MSVPGGEGGMVRGPFSLHIEQQQETRGPYVPTSKIILDIRTDANLKFTAPFPFTLKIVLKGMKGRKR